jgi:ribosomal protein S18 acetylase RimI-like enzyme
VTVEIQRVTDPVAAELALAATAGCARSASGLGAVLPRSDIHLLVAYDGDTPLGAVLGYELPRLLREGTGMLLYSIDVAEPHRQRGIGKALIATLREIAADRGCDATWLLTNTSNEAAMRLYESAGGKRPNQDDAMWEFPPKTGGA